MKEELRESHREQDQILKSNAWSRKELKRQGHVLGVERKTQEENLKF